MCLRRLWLHLALLGLANPNSYALDTDKRQPFNIAADYALIDRNANLVVYQGRVRVNQGTTYLQADKLVSQGANTSNLEKVEAFGRKAIYRTLPAQGQLEFIAKADIITYYPQRGDVVLLGGAEAKQGKNRFEGPHIEYNVKSHRVVAPASREGKAHIVIEPEQIK